VDVTTRREILRALWDLHITDPQLEGTTSQAYLDFYAKECILALHDGGRHILARTHCDVIDLAHFLQRATPSSTPPFTVRATREDAKTWLRQKLTKAHQNEHELLDYSVNLVAKLLLMTEIGGPEYGFSGRQKLIWTQGPLKDAVQQHFDEQKPKLGTEGVKLDRLFTARNLGRIAGMKIEWTDNLADHLRVMDEDTKVAIFHHASFLKNQHHGLFPQGFVEETLRTVALLFPQSESSSRKWYLKQARRSGLDTALIRNGQLRTDDRQIENFHYWRDRVIVLKQVFDEATPGTISQWWFDKRNVVQWYTFWVAALVLFLTVFFGLIQCIEGALQVYKAYNPS